MPQKINALTPASARKELERKIAAIQKVLKEMKAEINTAKLERDKTNAILQSIGDGVCVIDKDCRIILFNRAASLLTGHSQQAARGKKFDEVLKCQDETSGEPIKNFIQEVMARGVARNISRRCFLIRKDGKKIAIADSAAPLKSRGGKIAGCVIVFRDISKEREIDRMKTDFVSLTSHQLRTPLTAVRWYIEELYNGELGRLKAEQKEYLSQVLDSNQRMIKLINDLLNVSRLESGRLTIAPKPTQITELIEKRVKDYLPLAKAKNCGIEFKKPAKKIPLINIDPALISQVIDNLTSNAIKYSTGKGKRCSLAISVSLKKPNIIVSVRDEGIGIAKAEQSQVFERFFRGFNAIKLETEGSGLGLHIAKIIVKASGGKIWFSSRENQGSTFSFSLPLAGSRPHRGEMGLSRV